MAPELGEMVFSLDMRETVSFKQYEVDLVLQKFAGMRLPRLFSSVSMGQASKVSKTLLFFLHSGLEFTSSFIKAQGISMDSSIGDIAKDPVAKLLFNAVASVAAVTGTAVYYLHSSITSGDEETREKLDARIDKLDTKMENSIGKLDARIDKLDARIDKLDTKMESNNDKLLRELGLIRGDLLRDRQAASDERKASALERIAFSSDRKALKDEFLTSRKQKGFGDGDTP